MCSGKVLGIRNRQKEDITFLLKKLSASGLEKYDAVRMSYRRKLTY